MPNYRAYLIDPDGHIEDAIPLNCPDDKAAIEQANQYVSGHDVELWVLGRKVIQLKSECPK